MKKVKYDRKKYSHIGVSYPSVPQGWKPIVEKALIEIEKEMWVSWLPMFLKRWIHYLATGNSVVRIRSQFWYKIRKILTHGGMIVMDIKDKYSTLRIYGNFNDKIFDMIDDADKECQKTCEICGGKENVKLREGNWLYTLCDDCFNKNEK